MRTRVWRALFEGDGDVGFDCNLIVYNCGCVYTEMNNRSSIMHTVSVNMNIGFPLLLLLFFFCYVDIATVHKRKNINALSRKHCVNSKRKMLELETSNGAMAFPNAR